MNIAIVRLLGILGTLPIVGYGMRQIGICCVDGVRRAILKQEPKEHSGQDLGGVSGLIHLDARRSFSGKEANILTKLGSTSPTQ